MASSDFFGISPEYKDFPVQSAGNIDHFVDAFAFPISGWIEYSPAWCMGGTRKEKENGMKTHTYLYIQYMSWGHWHYPLLRRCRKHVAHSRAKPNATGFMLSPFNFQLAKAQVSKKTCHQNQHMEKSHSVSLLGLLADTLGRWFCTIRRSLGPRGVWSKVEMCTWIFWNDSSIMHVSLCFSFTRNSLIWKKYMQHEIIEKYTTYISLALADLDVLVREDATLQSSWYMSILCFASLLAASIAPISTEEGSLPEESTHLLVYHCMNARLYLMGAPRNTMYMTKRLFNQWTPNMMSGWVLRMVLHKGRQLKVRSLQLFSMSCHACT